MRLKLECVCEAISNWHILTQTVAYFLTFYDVLLVELTDYVEAFTWSVAYRNNHIYLYSPELSMIIK